MNTLTQLPLNTKTNSGQTTPKSVDDTKECRQQGQSDIQGISHDRDLEILWFKRKLEIYTNHLKRIAKKS